MAPSRPRASKKVKLKLKAASLAKFESPKSKAQGALRKHKRLLNSLVWTNKKQCPEPTAKELGDGSSANIRTESSALLDDLRPGFSEPIHTRAQIEESLGKNDKSQRRTRAEPRVPAQYSDRSYDPVIEQWYADPYRRQNPDAKSFDAARMLTLHDGLLRRGFTNRNIRDKLVLHIFSCQGTYKPMAMRRVTQKTKAATDLEQIKSSEDNNGSGCQPENCTVEQPGKDGDSLAKDMISAKLESTDGDELVKQEDTTVYLTTTPTEPQNHNTTKPAHRSVHEIATKPIPRRQAIARIKRCLRLFDMVYGRTGLPAPNYTGYTLDYMHSPTSLVPRPVPKIPLRTQGHKRLKRCTYAGKPVYAEDPTFGITPVAPSERISRADMSMHDEAYKRQQQARDFERAGVEWEVVSRRPFSDGYTEAWKDIVERGGVLVPRNEGARAGKVDVDGGGK